MKSARIKAAHDAVRAEGGRYLYFPKGCYRAPSLSEAADVIFVGEGELQLAYRKRVFSLFAPTAPTLPGGIRPAVHLRQLAKTVRGGRTAVVTLVGDSIATLADTIAPTEGIWECLQRKIRSDNPKAPFSFHHRAIGGGLWSLLDAAPPQDPGQLPPWYQNRAEPWLSYVEATQPDLLRAPFKTSDTKLAGISTNMQGL